MVPKEGLPLLYQSRSELHHIHFLYSIYDDKPLRSTEFVIVEDEGTQNSAWNSRVVFGLINIAIPQFNMFAFIAQELAHLEVRVSIKLLNLWVCYRAKSLDVVNDMVSRYKEIKNGVGGKVGFHSLVIPLCLGQEVAGRGYLKVALHSFV